MTIGNWKGCIRDVPTHLQFEVRQTGTHLRTQETIPAGRKKDSEDRTPSATKLCPKTTNSPRTGAPEVALAERKPGKEEFGKEKNASALVRCQD